MQTAFPFRNTDHLCDTGTKPFKFSTRRPTTEGLSPLRGRPNGYPHLGVPRVPSGGAGGREGGEDVRLPEGGEADLPLGGRVRALGAGEDALAEHDQGGAERLGVEEVGEGERGQVAAVPDEERLVLVDELGLDLGGAVLRAQSG